LSDVDGSTSSMKHLSGYAVGQSNSASGIGMRACGAVRRFALDVVLTFLHRHPNRFDSLRGVIGGIRQIASLLCRGSSEARTSAQCQRYTPSVAWPSMSNDDERQ
jgi:hypothetical protein